MNKRQSISKKTRFEVFKRDTFQCQYCGATPPSAVLEIDHLLPVSKGGSNDMDNLVTACFDCNRGKSDRLLTAVPESIEEKRQWLLEKEEQLKAYKNLKSSIKRRETKQINLVEQIFQETYPHNELSSKTKSTIRHQFMPKLEAEQIEYAMSKACSMIDSCPSRALKYFFGVCWGIIKGNNYA